MAPLCSQEGSSRGSLACGEENSRPCSRDDARPEPNSLRSFFLSFFLSFIAPVSCSFLLVCEIRNRNSGSRRSLTNDLLGANGLEEGGTCKGSLAALGFSPNNESNLHLTRGTYLRGKHSSSP